MRLLSKPKPQRRGCTVLHWLVAFGFFAFYVCIMLFLKVPTWSFAHEGHWEDSHCEVSGAGHNRTQVCTSHWVPPVNITTICDKRGDLTPACSATRYVDTWLLGYEHMYDGGPFKRSHWCSGCAPDECDLPDGKEKPGWCDSKLDPEGVLSSVPTVLTTCKIVILSRFVAVRLANPKVSLFQGSACTSALCSRTTLPQATG